MYATRFHRDHTVTLWNVYSQQWQRTARPTREVLESLSGDERAKVIRHCNIDSPTTHQP